MHRILLLGDGNFSFSLALARLLFDQTADVASNAAHTYLGLPETNDSLTQEIQLICTSFDSRDELLEKYPESSVILQHLEHYPPHRVQIRHRVNACELARHFSEDFPTGFDAIVWNHPHHGTEDFNLHRFLMAHFLASAGGMLRKNVSSKICVSLVQGQETRWDLVGQAQRLGLPLLDVRPFEEHVFPGYICKRNKTGQSFKNAATKRHVGTAMRSFVFRFSLDGGPTLQMEETEVLLEGLQQEFERMQVRPKRSAAKLKKDSTADLTDPDTAVVTFDPVTWKLKRRQKHYVRKSEVPESELIVPSLAAVPKSSLVIFQCPECPQKFHAERAASQHHQLTHVLHRQEEEQDLVCPFEGCSRIFKRYEDVWQHRANKHSTLSLAEERQLCLNDPHAQDSSDGRPMEQYAYYPCDICGQSVWDTQDPQATTMPLGMRMHLESFKPAMGLKMKCPLREANGNGHVWCKSTKSYTERRAMEQHFRLCRQRLLDSQMGTVVIDG